MLFLIFVVDSSLKHQQKPHYGLLLVNAKNENLYRSVGNKRKENEFIESIKDCLEYDSLELPKKM